MPSQKSKYSMTTGVVCILGIGMVCVVSNILTFLVMTPAKYGLVVMLVGGAVLIVALAMIVYEDAVSDGKGSPPSWAKW